MNPWFISASLIAIIVAAAGGYFQGSEHGQAKIQALWDKEKAAQYAEYAKGQEAARAKEQELQAGADRLRREKDAEIRNLNARAVALNNSLQHRPTRTSEAGSVSDTSKSCSGASGKELARGDAEFLVRYASEAARLQADLNQCIRQYEALRK